MAGAAMHTCANTTAGTECRPHAAPLQTLVLPSMPTHRAVAFLKAMPTGNLRSDGVCACCELAAATLFTVPATE
jgi:hypothetical protein